VTRDYRQIHHSAIVVDTHADTFGRMSPNGVEFFADDSPLAVSLPKMDKGGLDVQMFALYVDPALSTPVEVLAMAGRFFRTIEMSNGSLVFATTACDIRQSVAAGKKCALLSIEGGHAIADSIDVLRAYRRLGVVSLTLTHANSHGWADSSQDDRRWGGLNELGRRIIREMNDLQMLIDVSHASDETVLAVLECSRQPVIASHSCCRALCDHPRNLSDELIVAIAQKGGAININYYPPYIDPVAGARWQAGWTRLKEEQRRAASEGEGVAYGGFYAACERCLEDMPPISIRALCDHIDHAVSLVGPEHVGLGSDWDGATVMPLGLETCETLPAVTEELVGRGYSEAELRLILGESFLRLFRTVIGS
jgi:membrane dipeptidase